MEHHTTRTGRNLLISTVGGYVAVYEGASLLCSWTVGYVGGRRYSRESCLHMAREYVDSLA